MTAPPPSPAAAPSTPTSSQNISKDAEGMSEGKDFTTEETKVEPLSLYRVEGARHNDDSTGVQLSRRGKLQRALSIMNPLWEHVYITKGSDRTRHNHIYWGEGAQAGGPSTDDKRSIQTHAWKANLIRQVAGTLDGSTTYSL